MEFVRIPGNALLTKLDQEQQSGADGADMALYTETPWHAERAKQGRFKAPAGPAARTYPAEYLIHGVAPVMAMQPFVIAYNTNLVKTPVSGYQDLMRPEFKGKLGTSGLVAVALVAWYEWLEQTQGSDFLPKFAAQNPRYFVGAVSGTQSVAAGELAAMAFSIPGVANPLIEQGAPLKVVFPKPSLGQRDLGVVLAWSKRPNAALVFQDYLMSTRGRTTWNGKGETASPLPGIAGSLDPKTINVFDSGKYTNDVVKVYTEKWNKLFKPAQ